MGSEYAKLVKVRGLLSEFFAGFEGKRRTLDQIIISGYSSNAVEDIVAMFSSDKNVFELIESEELNHTEKLDPLIHIKAEKASDFFVRFGSALDIVIRDLVSRFTETYSELCYLAGSGDYINCQEKRVILDRIAQDYDLLGTRILSYGRFSQMRSDAVKLYVDNLDARRLMISDFEGLKEKFFGFDWVSRQGLLNIVGEKRLFSKFRSKLEPMYKEFKRTDYYEGVHEVNRFNVMIEDILRDFDTYKTIQADLMRRKVKAEEMRCYFFNDGQMEMTDLLHHYNLFDPDDVHNCYVFADTCNELRSMYSDLRGMIIRRAEEYYGNLKNKFFLFKEDVLALSLINRRTYDEKIKVISDIENDIRKHLSGFGLGQEVLIECKDLGIKCLEKYVDGAISRASVYLDHKPESSRDVNIWKENLLSARKISDDLITLLVPKKMHDKIQQFSVTVAGNEEEYVRYLESHERVTPIVGKLEAYHKNLESFRCTYEKNGFFLEMINRYYILAEEYHGLMVHDISGPLFFDDKKRMDQLSEDVKGLFFGITETIRDLVIDRIEKEHSFKNLNNYWMIKKRLEKYCLVSDQVFIGTVSRISDEIIEKVNYTPKDYLDMIQYLSKRDTLDGMISDMLAFHDVSGIGPVDAMIAAKSEYDRKKAFFLDVKKEYDAIDRIISELDSCDAVLDELVLRVQSMVTMKEVEDFNGIYELLMTYGTKKASCSFVGEICRRYNNRAASLKRKADDIFDTIKEMMLREYKDVRTAEGRKRYENMREMLSKHYDILEIDPLPCNDAYNNEDRKTENLNLQKEGQTNQGRFSEEIPIISIGSVDSNHYGQDRVYDKENVFMLSEYVNNMGYNPNFSWFWESIVNNRMNWNQRLELIMAEMVGKRADNACDQEYAGKIRYALGKTIECGAIQSRYYNNSRFRKLADSAVQCIDSYLDRGR